MQTVSHGRVAVVVPSTAAVGKRFTLLAAGVEEELRDSVIAATSEWRLGAGVNARLPCTRCQTIHSTETVENSVSSNVHILYMYMYMYTTNKVHTYMYVYIHM